MQKVLSTQVHIILLSEKDTIPAKKVPRPAVAILATNFNSAYVRINFGLNLPILSHKSTTLVLFNEKRFLQLLLNIRQRCRLN